MDLELPLMTGIQAITEIMTTAPCPIIVLSGHLDKGGLDRTFDSFQAGAVDVLAKPRGLSDEELERFAARLLRSVRVMSQARDLRRRGGGATAQSATNVPTPQPVPTGPFDIILIGASTGGPIVVRNLLEKIPAPYPLPIVLCQHIVPSFEHGMAQWLSETGHRVSVVNPGDSAEAGRVYVARADQHLAMKGMDLAIMPAMPKHLKPSVDVLFESAAVTLGRRCAAFLLTGMGEDGRRGLLALKQRGALTVTQSAETCVVNGMPAVARAAGASTLDLSPPKMVELLKQIAQSKKSNIG
jgi:two-component system, chemotaxis family, protein-glutamate methylesterase/glutaminase